MSKMLNARVKFYSRACIITARVYNFTHAGCNLTHGNAFWGGRASPNMIPWAFVVFWVTFAAAGAAPMFYPRMYFAAEVCTCV